jgi:hypothetical protein
MQAGPIVTLGNAVASTVNFLFTPTCAAYLSSWWSRTSRETKLPRASPVLPVCEAIFVQGVIGQVPPVRFHPFAERAEILLDLYFTSDHSKGPYYLSVAMSHDNASVTRWCLPGRCTAEFSNTDKRRAHRASFALGSLIFSCEHNAHWSVTSMTFGRRGNNRISSCQTPSLEAPFRLL